MRPSWMAMDWDSGKNNPRTDPPGSVADSLSLCRKCFIFCYLFAYCGQCLLIQPVYGSRVTNIHWLDLDRRGRRQDRKVIITKVASLELFGGMGGRRR